MIRNRIQRIVAGVVFVCAAICLPLSGAIAGGPYSWWRNERARRLVEIQHYLEKNHAAFESFRTAPLSIKQGPLNFVGMSMIVFRLLPELFPDIWGPPEDKLAVVGLGIDPFDPNGVMPIGVGYALSAGFSIPDANQQDVQVNYATFSCMGCHSGGVVGPQGNLIRFVGGANPFGDYGGKLNQTVNDPRYTAENFRDALSQEPIGWVYGNPAELQQEVLERALFQAPGGAEFFLQEVKTASNQSTQRVADTLLAYTYNVPNPSLPSGMPGSLDVFGLGGASLCDPNGNPPCDIPTVMPAAPAPSDIPTAWQMIGHPRYQWDHSVGSLTYREVLASASLSAGDPTAVNIDNVVLAGPFTELLPAQPYPFDVDLPSAARGERIFRQSCMYCHKPGNRRLFTPAETGTDPNRANVLTDAIITGLISYSRQACTAPQCFEANGQPFPDDEILKATLRYASGPLDGIWASGPYLHNGSVPTLYHLLTGDRPATFYRGNFTYDQKFVGFTWAQPTNPGLSLLYDTSLDGNSNTGHTGPAFNGGINWKKEPQKLWDLLEYLKTL